VFTHLRFNAVYALVIATDAPGMSAGPHDGTKRGTESLEEGAVVGACNVYPPA
jgi:hypothetical protein